MSGKSQKYLFDVFRRNCTRLARFLKPEDREDFVGWLALKFVSKKLPLDSPIYKTYLIDYMRTHLLNLRAEYAKKIVFLSEIPSNTAVPSGQENEIDVQKMREMIEELPNPYCWILFYINLGYEQQDLAAFYKITESNMSKLVAKAQHLLRLKMEGKVTAYKLASDTLNANQLHKYRLSHLFLTH